MGLTSDVAVDVAVDTFGRTDSRTTAFEPETRREGRGTGKGRGITAAIARLLDARCSAIRGGGVTGKTGAARSDAVFVFGSNFCC